MSSRLFASAIFAIALLAACDRAGLSRGRDAELDRLFNQLSHAHDAGEAAPLERRIWERWSDSGSPTVDVLLDRADAAQDDGAPRRALEFLTRASELAPDYAEPWNRRARIAYEMHDIPGAIAAIRETLRREPRHFGALTALGLIYEELGQDRAALNAFRAALAVHAYYEPARLGADRLAAELEGREA